MTKYLFIGGPRAGQWCPVPNGERSWRVPEIVETRFGDWLDDEIRIHLYTPRRVMVSGWLVPLTFFVHESIRWGQPIPRGTVLPGFVVGVRMDASPTSVWWPR